MGQQSKGSARFRKAFFWTAAAMCVAATLTRPGRKPEPKVSPRLSPAPPTGEIGLSVPSMPSTSPLTSTTLASADPAAVHERAPRAWETTVSLLPALEPRLEELGGETVSSNGSFTITASVSWVQPAANMSFFSTDPNAPLPPVPTVTIDPLTFLLALSQDAAVQFQILDRNGNPVSNVNYTVRTSGPEIAAFAIGMWPLRNSGP